MPHKPPPRAKRIYKAIAARYPLPPGATLPTPKIGKYGHYTRHGARAKSNLPRNPGTPSATPPPSPAVYALLCIYNISLCIILYIRFRLFIAFAYIHLFIHCFCILFSFCRFCQSFMQRFCIFLYFYAVLLHNCFCFCYFYTVLLSLAHDRIKTGFCCPQPPLRIFRHHPPKRINTNSIIMQ